MQKTHVHVDPDNPTTFPQGKVDEARLDATTDEAIREHIAQDEAAAMQEMGRYVRTIRARVGMSQRDFAHATGVSVDTLRNWEQGRRYPTATARALLKILDRSPEAALAALRDSASRAGS